MLGLGRTFSTKDPSILLRLTPC